MGLVRWESERGIASRGQKSEASTRLHCATAWPANDELTFVLIIVIVEATKCESEDRELGKSSAQRIAQLSVIC
jgi:hypothetical protein